MKKGMKRIVSMMLVIVMIFAMVPVVQVTTPAAEVTTITKFDDLDFLGAGYNLLGDKELNSTTLTGAPIFNEKIVDHVFAKRTTGSSTIYSYSYIKDMDSYLRGRSSDNEMNLGFSAGVKMFAMQMKIKYGAQVNVENSGSTTVEYGILEASKKLSYSYMSFSSSLADVWADEAVSAQFAADAKTKAPDEFFAKYGTHILVGYSSGGGAFTTYNSESLYETFKSVVTANGEISGYLEAPEMVKLDGALKMKASEEDGGSDSSQDTASYSTSYGADGTLAWDGSMDSVNSFFNTITEKSSQPLVDSDLKFIPIWDLLEASGDGEILARIAALKEYYRAEIAKDCADLYEDLGLAYVSDEASEDVDEWTDYSDINIITTPEEFNNIRNDLYGVYVLANNIDLSGYENWTPIGTAEAPFMGKLFGNYNTVSGLNITQSSNGYAGLFGYSSGTVKNLQVNGTISVTASSDVYIGGVVAYNRGSVVKCFDNVDYNVDYSSVSALNIPVRTIDLTSASAQTISIGDENGIRLVGKSGTTYSGINIVVEDNDVTSPAYIILDNVNIVGDSANGTIYSNNDRPIYIISTGASNSIKGADGNLAVNAKSADVFIFGDAIITITGGSGLNGSDGSDGTAGADNDGKKGQSSSNSGQGYTGEAGKIGEDGTDGSIALVSSSLIVNSLSTVNIIGGNGGNGGKGGNGKNGGQGAKEEYWNGGQAGTGGTGSAGGNGGNGGNGGAPADISTSITVYNGELKLISGLGGNGGKGGNGGNGGKGGTATAAGSSPGAGGTGGAGGKGGSNGVGSVIVFSNCFVYNNAVVTFDSLGNGSVGSGGSGGSGGSKGSQQDLASAGSASAGSSGKTGSSGTYVSGNVSRVQLYSSGTVSTFNAPILSGITSGYNSSAISKINQLSWNNNALQVESISQIDYFSGDAFDRDDVIISVSGSPVADFLCSFDSSCASNHSNRTGYIKITRDSYVRYIPVHITRTLPISMEISEIGNLDFVIDTAFNIKGLILKIQYNNGVVEYINDGDLKISYSLPDLSSIGTRTVNVYYDHDYDESTDAFVDSYSINVVASSVVGIEITQLPDFRVFDQGEEFVAYGILVRKIMNNGTYSNLDSNALKYNLSSSMCTAGTKTVTVSYAGFTAEYTITVNERAGYEHKWNSGEITTPATHLAAGTKTYTCTVADCGATKTEEIAKLEGHAFGSWSKYNDEQHKRECVCGEIEYAVHTWNAGEITTPSTHLTFGAKTYTCTVANCGATKTEEIAKLEGHSFGEWFKYDDTQHKRECACTEAEYEKHAWDSGVVTQEPTATQIGELRYTCTTCSATKTEIIPASGVPEIDENAPSIVVETVRAAAGDTVTLNVILKNNPGFAGMNAYLTYSDVLELVAVENKIPMTFTNGTTLVWDSDSNYSSDGLLMTLTFKVAENAEDGDYAIYVHFIDAFNLNLDDVTFHSVSGKVTVKSVVYGDADGDGLVNTKDIILIRKYVAAKDPITGISAVEISAGADANGDGTINTKDIILVRKYVAAKDPVTGESSIVLGPDA